MNDYSALAQGLAPRVGAMQSRDSNGLPLLTYPERPTHSCGVPRGFANLFVPVPCGLALLRLPSV